MSRCATQGESRRNPSEAELWFDVDYLSHNATQLAAPNVAIPIVARSVTHAHLRFHWLGSLSNLAKYFKYRSLEKSRTSLSTKDAAILADHITIAGIRILVGGSKPRIRLENPANKVKGVYNIHP
jgi:hypothetical protein